MRPSLPTLSAGFALVLSLFAARAEFVGPTGIVIDGLFGDWSEHVYSQGNGFSASGNGGAGHITRVSYAMSTANGTAPATAANPIRNVFFRMDTGLANPQNPKQSYWVQLNLGTAPIGFADHVLQFFVDTSATPKVAIVLYQYAAPYPAIKVFTTTAFSPKVSNLPSGYGAYDANAVGAWAFNGTTYSFEARVPISWYGPAYGGTVSADGTGADMIASAIFTSTGSLGAKGTAQDKVADSSGNLYYSQVSASTGGSSFVMANPSGGAYLATATAATLTPGAGTTNNVTLTVYKTDGTTVDTAYTGLRNVVLRGSRVAPNGTRGSFKGVTLIGAPQTFAVNFVGGVATAPLALNAASAQTIGLSLPDVTFQAANDLAVAVTPGPVSALAFVTPPVMDMAGHPSGTLTVQRQDQFGNPNPVEAQRTVSLSSDSVGAVSFAPAGIVTIGAGASSASFTYLDTQPGHPLITAASGSPTTITSATQQVTVVDATSVITRIIPAGAAVTMTFVGVPGWNYVVERTSDLVHGPWIPLDGSVTNAPASSVWTHLDLSPPRQPSFYRARHGQ